MLSAAIIDDPVSKMVRNIGPSRILGRLEELNWTTLVSPRVIDKLGHTACIVVAPHGILDTNE